MIVIRNLSKQFRLYSRRIDRLWEWLGAGPRHRAFWALRNVDLEVPRGRTLGIIGPNGAGKSTLLKIVTGTLAPTSGTIEVKGRVAALLELGTGFHHEFTGRQNIWINGQLLGLSADEIARREPEIVDFSELGPFIDQPIRTYSSGMVVRLGFSIAASVDPDVLIVDEALSVGDAHFSQKCIKRIRQFRDKGTTILFVSHDPGAVVSLCDEAALFDAGEIVARGRPEPILEEYTALLARKGERNVEMTVKYVEGGDDRKEGRRRVGTFQALVTGVRWLNAAGAPAETLVSGRRATLEIEVLFLSPIEEPTVGFLIRDRLGQDVFGTNTRRMGLRLGAFEPGDRLRLRAAMDLNLGAGDFSLTTAIHRDETHLDECFDWNDRHYLFRVAAAPNTSSYGLVRLAPEWTVAREEAARGEMSAALESLFGELPARYAPGQTLRPSPYLQGFHEVENDGAGHLYRWTTDDALFTAAVPADGVARLHVAAWGRPRGKNAQPVTVSLEALGRSLGERVLQPWEDARLEWEVPKEKGGRVSLFRLRVSPAFVENNEGAPPRSTDARTGRVLGVALLGVGPENEN